MKKKICSILVLIMMILNNSAIIPIASAISDTENNPETIVDTNLSKYVNYDKNGNKGLVVELNIKTGVNFADLDKNSIESSSIEVQLPKIEGVYPENVAVVSRKTESTNGKTSSIEEKYDYHQVNGKLNIETSNDKDENGNLYTPNSNDVRDDYEVICNYNGTAYTSDEKERNIDVNVNVKQRISNVGEISKNQDFNFKETNNIGQLTTISVETDDIYNGYIRSNVYNNTEYETKYNENQEIIISNINVSNKIQISEKDNIDDVIINKTTIDKNQLLKLIGQDGKLDILNSAGDLLSEITKDSSDNNGKIEINYSEPQQELVIKTSKLEKNGILNIQNEKTIQKTYKDLDNKEIISNNSISEIAEVKQQVKVETNGLNTTENNNTITTDNQSEIKEEIVDKEISNNNYENKVEIKDATSKVDFNVNKRYLTNNIQNDVILTAKLLANDSSCSLFKNPTLKIQLPEEVEKVILQNSVMLYNNGLEIKNITTDNNSILIELNGEQNGYSINDVSNGAEIKISATLILSKTMESKNSEIKLDVNNKEDNSKIEKIAEVSLFAKDSITKAEEPVYTNSTKDSVDGIAVNIVTLRDNKEIQTSDPVKLYEKIRVAVSLTNTTSSVISNVGVSGIIPTGAVAMKGGDTDPVDNRDNEFDDKYIEDAGKTSADFTNITLNAGENKVVYYEIMVTQANVTLDNNILLSKNGSTIGNYHAYNTTVDGQLDLRMKVDYEVGKGINAYYYLLTVENKTASDMNNVILSADFLNGLTLTRINENDTGTILDSNYTNNVMTVNVGSIKAGEKISYAIRATANKLEEGKSNVDIPFTVAGKADGIEEHYSNTIIETAYVPVISVQESCDKEGEIVKSGEEVNYTITIKNVTSTVNSLTNTFITIKNKLPAELIGETAEYEVVRYDSTTKQYEKSTITKDLTEKTSVGNQEAFDINYDTMILDGGTLTLKIKAKVSPVYEVIEVGDYTSVTGTEIDAQISNIVKIKAAPENYVENPEPDPTVPTEDPTIPTEPTTPEIPNGITNGTNDPTIPTNNTVPENEMKPNDPSTGNNNTNTNTTTGNTTTGGNTDNGSSDSNETQVYSISGVAWMDDNSDGRRDTGETKLSSITIRLFNADNNSYVKDSNGDILKTVTDENGIYSFKKLAKGNYIVVAEYDSNQYSITEYCKNGVPTSVNSDFIAKELTIDGTKKQVGVTDALNITESLTNIDLGLIKSAKFDLKLQKYINKITVSNASGKRNYSYENTKLAKIEIPSKYISNSTIVIEYKISITNEGDIAGYANEIIDYLPNEMKFNSELNKEWFKKSNGIMTNTTLLNTVINPGETKDVYLTLTYNTTANSGGTIINTAEIGKSSNSQGINDIDSTFANNAKGEDDTDSAQMLLSVGTGAGSYIIGTIAFIALLVIAFVILKKFKNVKLRTFVLILLLAVGGLKVQINAYSTINNDTSGRLHENGEVDIIYDDLYASIHGGHWTVNHSDGTYWCISPGYGLCNEGDHYFEDDGDDTFKTQSSAADALGAYDDSWNLPETETDSSSVPEIDPQLSDSSIIQYTTTKTKIGPYSMTYNSSDYDSFSMTYSAKDGGTDITSDVDFIVGGSTVSVDQIASGQTFYVEVPSKVNNINITINFEASKTVTQNSIYVTYYVCTSHDCTWPACNEDGVQDLITVEPDSYDQTYTKTGSVSFSKVLKGGLKVTKMGESGSLKNVKFIIHSQNYGWISDINYTEYSSSKSSAYEFTSNSSGIIQCGNLIPDTYEIYEVYNQNYGYKGNVDKDNYKITVTVTAGDIASDTIENDQQLGNLFIKKRSEDYPSTDIQANVGYIVGIKEGSSGTEKYLSYSGSSYKSSKSSASVYYADSNGELTIEDLEVYYDKNAKYVYVVYEVSNPNIGYKGCLTTSNVQCKSSDTVLTTDGTESITLKNDKKMTNLTVTKRGSNGGELQEDVEFKIKATTADGESSYVVIDNQTRIKGTYSTTEQYPKLSYSSSGGTIFVTDSSGKIYIPYLEIYSELNGTYTYEAIEQYNPNYGYKGSTNYHRSDTTTDLRSDNSLLINNTDQLGDLTILKKGSNNETLSGVTFRIKCDGKYIQFVSSSGTVMKGTGNIVGNASQSMTYNINRISGADVTGSFNGKIKYVDNVSDATIFMTDVNGKVNITGLEVYKNYIDARFLYQIDELRNYNYGYKGTINQNRDNISYGYLTTDQLLTLQVGNTQQLGDIYIKKVDSRATQIPLPNVGFKVQITDGSTTNYIRINNSDRINGVATINLNGSNLNTSATDSNATVFLTDSNGELTIKNLERFYGIDSKYKYTLIEVENPYFGYWLNSAYVQWQVNSGTLISQSNASQNKVTATITLEDAAGSTTSVSRVLNQNIQKYTQVSGYVWIDYGQNTKSIHFDSVYDPSVAHDVLANGIKVTLYKNGTALKSEYTDSNGAYKFGQYISANDNRVTVDGYTIDSVLLVDISQYWIEFEYNGVKYESVQVQLLLANGSKAKEKDADRTIVNQRYSTISGMTYKDPSTGENTGKSSTGNYTLNYDSPSDYSTKIQYCYGNSTINDYYGLDQYHIKADTATAGGSPFTYTPTNLQQLIDGIVNINLGMVEREQPDLAISQDIDNVQLQLNGNLYTYTYALRNSQTGVGTGTAPNVDYSTTRYNVDFRYQNQYTNKYTRTIYPNDIQYNATTATNKNINMTVTYKVNVINQSNTLDTTVNNIVEYYDAKYSKVPTAYTADKTPLTVTSAVGNAEYNKVSITGSAMQQKISANSILTIYLQYVIDKPNLMSMLSLSDDDLSAGKSTELNCVVEIASFTSFYKGTNTLYAGIDLDSAPENALIGTETTYEDDTDKAPTFAIVVADHERQLDGYVWEDEKETDLTSQLGRTIDTKERLGNGYKDDSEKSIVYNAKVELCYAEGCQSEGAVKDAVALLADGVTPASTYTNKDGWYEFIGVVPDKYYIKYTYDGYTYILETNKTYNYSISNINKNNHNQVTVTDSTGTALKAIDIRDYKSTIITSSPIKNALQNGDKDWFLKTPVEKYSNAIDSLASRSLQDTVYYGVIKNDPSQSIEASTALMRVNIEYTIEENTQVTNTDGTGYTLIDGVRTYTHEKSNMDFGIIERPYVKFDVSKVVDNIKITLSNGQILLNGNPYTDNLNYIKQMPGYIYAEIDNELIEGSTLEITYKFTITNKCEIDYKETGATGYVPSKPYYFFGEIAGEKTDAEITKFADYLNSDLKYIGGYNSDKSTALDWTATTPTDLHSGGEAAYRISDEVYNTLMGITNEDKKYSTYYTDAFKNLALDETKSVYMVTSKVLSNKDEIYLDNHCEIMELSGGRKVKDCIPGNHDPLNSATFETDDSYANVAIVPPTGININVYIYIGIGLIALITLGGGIFFIKKKAIK